MRILLLILSMVFLAACSKTESENVKTAGLYVSFHVEMDEYQTLHCFATFQVGGSTGTYLELTGGDDVECNGVSMHKSDVLGMVTYSTNVPANANNTYSIRFTRPGEPDYVAVTYLPADFSITAPVAESTINKTQSFEARWSASTNSKDNMNVDVSANTGGTSYYSSLTDSPEHGLLRFDPIITDIVAPPPGTWTSKITYTRYRYFSTPSGLDGSTRASRKKQNLIYFVD